MSLGLDIIIAIIIAVSVYMGYKNGLIKTVISASAFIIAIIITALFSSQLAEAMKETSIAQTITETTEQKITDMLIEESHDVADLIEGKSEEFNILTDFVGIEGSDLKNWYLDNMAENNVEALLAEKIAAPIIDTVALLSAVLVLYIGTQIVLSIIAFLLNKLAKLPVLKTFNKGGGLLIGAVLALVRVCLFCFAIDVLIEHSAFLGNNLISNLNPDNTILFRIFHEINLFDFFVK